MPPGLRTSASCSPHHDAERTGNPPRPPRRRLGVPSHDGDLVSEMREPARRRVETECARRTGATTVDQRDSKQSTSVSAFYLDAECTGQNDGRCRGTVWGAVSPGKPRHFEETAPRADARKPLKTGKLQLLVVPLIRMGFRGSRVRIPPSRSCGLATTSAAGPHSFLALPATVCATVVRRYPCFWTSRSFRGSDITASIVSSSTCS